LKTHRHRWGCSVLIASVLFCGACQVPVKPVNASFASDRVFQKNYALGVQQAVYVGQPVVRFKDYLVKVRHGAHMRATKTFKVKQAMSGWTEVSANADLLIVASLEKDGVTYNLARLTDHNDGSYTAVLVGPDGVPYRKLAGKVPPMENPVLMAGTVVFDPADVRFLQGPDESVIDENAGFTNYELIYGGTDGRAFTLTYREYSPQDLIRPAFTQQLSYENGSSAIRFRETKIQVHSVTSEQLSYTVLSDETASPK
jgi:hypothetical protein